MQSVAAALDSPSIPWVAIALSLVGAVFVFETLVELRQLPRLNHKSPESLPALQPLLRILGQGEEQTKNLHESQAYARDKLHFALFASCINLIETMLIMAPVWRGETGLARIWSAAGEVDTHRVPHGRSLIFLVYMSALSSLTSIPSSYYRTFVLEAKHGFNKTTLSTWVADQIKGTALSAIFLLPIIAVLLEIIDRTGEAFVQWVCIFVLCLQLAAVLVYPYIIAPLFNKFTHLSDSQYASLQPALEKLALRIGFPLKKVWVIDGSKRSAHSNAFFFGLPYLPKHIVLYDTLLAKQSAEEVEAVLAHELGHFKHNDSRTMLLVGQVNIILTLSLYRFFLFNRSLYAAFGILPTSTLLAKAATFLGFGGGKLAATGGLPIIIGFSLASSVLAPLETFSSFGIHALTRRLEFRADAFAQKLGYQESLVRGLATLMSENKGITDHDPLYSALHHSHPTVQERVARLEATGAVAKKAQ